MAIKWIVKSIQRTVNPVQWKEKEEQKTKKSIQRYNRSS